MCPGPVHGQTEFQPVLPAPDRHCIRGDCSATGVHFVGQGCGGPDEDDDDDDDDDDDVGFNLKFK